MRQRCLEKLLLAVIAVAVIVLSMFPSMNVYAEANWLSGWSYRKSHVIIGSTAGDVSGYQIRIVVYYGAGKDSRDTM